MSNYPLSKYSAQIKDVYIELKNYQYFHSPYDENNKTNRFIGREKVKDRIISVLKDSSVKSGAYLITGFRGMGKTSIIRQALHEFNEDARREPQNKNKTVENSLRLRDKFKQSFAIVSDGFKKLFRIFLGYIVIYLILQFLFLSSPLAQRLPWFIAVNSAIFFFVLLFSHCRGLTSDNGKMWRLGHFIGFLAAVLLICCFGIYFFSPVIGSLEIANPLFVSLIVEVIFFILFSLHALLVLNRTKEVFEYSWKFFKSVLVIFLFTISIVFFLSYNSVCNVNCPVLINDLMSRFFPPLRFDKTPNDKKDGSTQQNANSTVIVEENPPADGKKDVSIQRIINSREIDGKNQPTTDSDLFPVVFRILVSVFFSFLILTLLLFIFDWLSLSARAVKPAEKKKKYHSFEINLSQESLDEMDVLRRITIQLEEYWLSNKLSFVDTTFNRKIYRPWEYIISKIDRPRQEHFRPSYRSISAKLNILKNRMSGQMTTRRERRQPPNLTAPIAGLGEISMPIGAFLNNDEVAFPIANAKEVEDQLREILDDIDKIREDPAYKIPEFVFIIDELDKIDPHNANNIQQKESANPVLDSSIYTEDTNIFRQRREAVGKLLANLKGFLNVARAKFFFIGGREMFDADLADIADRESFYSSIFNDVIYVESFFKDSTESAAEGKGGITQMTESYVCRIILNSSQNESNRQSLKKLFELIDIENDYLILRSASNEKTEVSAENRRRKYKVISTLQNYIIYLTYRSSGTPKKLTNLTEQLIVRGPKKINNEEFFRENIVVLHEPDKNSDSDKTDLSEKLFLKFGFNTQYEIGLTSNLYRPYLISNSRHLKSLGDKLLFSSSFIIDHILKFHPFGFSWRNLELIPEVVLVNREPNLREFIEDLMRFYSTNYIRDTVSGIFDYRFKSIIRRELIHLSKTSDLSAAAFNFTLDESLSTKRHYKRKLIELREKYANYTPVEGDNQFIHAIHFVQTILGDLHFYDKEYDEAVLFYTESIQTLRLPNAITDRKITRHQFLLWVKNKLKLGLTLEKIRAFDSAFSLYKTLILDTERYLENIVSKEDVNRFNRNPIINKDEAENKFAAAEDHRTMHLICMPFVALLAVTEKTRNDGITYTNLFTNRRDFLRTINFDKNNKDEQKYDSYRKNYLMADYYNNVGSLLYYKNCQFSKFFDDKKGDYRLEAFFPTRYEYFIPKLKLLGHLSNPIIDQQNKIYNQNKIYKDDKNKVYDFFPSLTAFNYYWNSLYFLLEYHHQRLTAKVDDLYGSTKPDSENEKVPLKENLLALSTAYLLPECVDMVSGNRIYYIANVISKIGDSILASLNSDSFKIPEEKNGMKFDALDITSWEKDGDKNRDQAIKWFRTNVGDNLFSAEAVLYIYKLAAALYKRAGHNAYYASHLIRMLYVIKDLIELNKNENEKIGKFLSIDQNKNRPFEQIEKIAEAVFRATTWNNDVSNRPQILKYREIFDINIDRNQDREQIYNIINNTSDNKEVLVLVESIKLKLNKNVPNFVKDFTKGKSIISAYGTMSNRYQRMLELKYRTERCYYIINNVLDLGQIFERDFTYTVKEEFSNISKDIFTIIEEGIKDEPVVKINDVVAFLIQEALFSSSQLIKMIKLYNPGYVIGYSFLAEAHSRMGAWSQAYENYLKIMNEDIFTFDNIYDKHLKFLKDTKAFIEGKINTENPNEVKEQLEDERDTVDSRINDWESNKVNIEKLILDKSEVDEIKNNIKKGENNASKHLAEKIIADCPKILEDEAKIHLKIRVCRIETNKLLKLFDKKENHHHYEQIEKWLINLDKVIKIGGIPTSSLQEVFQDKNFNLDMEYENNLLEIKRSLKNEINNETDGQRITKLEESRDKVEKYLNDWKRTKEIFDKNSANEINRRFEYYFKSDKENSDSEPLNILQEADKEYSVNQKIIWHNRKELQDLFKDNQNSYTYETLQNWLKKQSKIEELKTDKTTSLKEAFENRIKYLLGSESLNYLEPRNHYESAVQNYYKMIQLHSDGKTYKDKLHEIYMLEDDYNDNTAHYTIAAERIRINTGKIKSKINSLKNKIGESKVYVYDSYLTSDGERSSELSVEDSNLYMEFFGKQIN